MPTITHRSIKLGASLDTSQNFVFEVPAIPDGTLTIKRESGAAVATIDAAGKVVFPGNAQTWQTMVGKVPGTEYTNTSGQPIDLHITMSSTTQTTLNIVINGLMLQSAPQLTAGQTIQAYARVPAGAVYSATTGSGTPSIIAWRELR